MCYTKLTINREFTHITLKDENEEQIFITKLDQDIQNKLKIVFLAYPIQDLENQILSLFNDINEPNDGYAIDIAIDMIYQVVEFTPDQISYMITEAKNMELC